MKEREDDFMTHCSYVMPSGEGCRAAAGKGSSLCFYHDPKQREKRIAASAAGGHARGPTVLPLDTASVALRSPGDVLELLGLTVNEVRRGEIAPSIAWAIGNLANIALRAISQGVVEERLRAIEAVASAKWAD